MSCVGGEPAVALLRSRSTCRVSVRSRLLARVPGGVVTEAGRLVPTLGAGESALGGDLIPLD